MTVIVLFEDLNLALSDVLLTVADVSANAVIPTIGRTGELPDLKLGVSRLVRKVISAEGPVGRAECLVAGTVSHIKYFSNLLRQIFKGQIQLPDDLHELVRSSGASGCFEAAARLADSDGFKDFEVFGVVGSNTCCHTFDTIRITENIPYFGRVWIAGSGAPSLIHWLKIRGETYSDTFREHNLNKKRFHVANMVPVLLMEEDMGPGFRTLKDGVGGYYEAFSFDSDGLYPVDNSLTIFADIVGRKRDCRINLRKIIYHCYRSDHLYILSLAKEVEVKASSTVKIPLKDFMYFEVPPLEGQGSLSPWNVHVVASRMFGADCVRTVIRKAVSGSLLTKRFFRSEPGHEIVSLSLSGKNLVVELNEDGLNYFSSTFPGDPADAFWV